MTVSTSKPKRNRLDWSAQWGADPSKNRINPADEARKHAQFARHMPEPPNSGPKKLDQCARWPQHGAVSVLLGECRFRQRFPNIQVNFGLYDWSTATNMLRNRLADVGLITDAPVSDAWERIHIESAEYVLYCPNEHLLSAQACVSLEDLQEETVIIPERGSLTRKLLENACRTHAVALERTVTMATFPLMYEAVLQGIGVAVFLCNSSLIKKSVTEIPIREMPQKLSVVRVFGANGVLN